MIVKDIEALQIHKLSKAQFLRELEKGTIDEEAFYLTPKEEVVTAITETSTDEEVPSAKAVYNYVKNNVKNIVVGDSTVDSSGDSIVIPIATTELSGVVKSSEDTNSISVQDDGTMEVNEINVNKIVQDSGDTLILESGDSFIKENN